MITRNTPSNTSVKKLRITLAGLLALTVVPLAAACGGSGSSGGPSITVGSKNFTEQVVLGELYAQVLEEEDFDVNRKLDLGNVTTLDQALQSGNLTMYPEYTGTSLVQALGEEDADYPSPQATYDAAEEGYESRDPAATLLAPVDYNNSYAITVPKDVAQEYDLETVEDLAGVSDELTLASFGECQENPACFPNVKDNYDVNFEEVTLVDSLGLRYQALKQGDAQAAIGFTTDAQLLSDDLVVLDEEKDIWPYYYAAPVIDQSYLDEHPRVADVVNPVSESLGVNDIRNLNGRVDLDNEDPADVAEDYLENNGFLE
ncbi:ABC transporter substrate-binding protein [Rubrobacter aplysinae]|uniref:ABC transporter substrate-binding protein n=1 Tax=Rubrobacter aplysinae TaxID=909625 RepID=UPI00069F0466|nr:glycine betaine ABC transporter substrate-binding protein [Rubrobacter aplysinae]